MWHTAGHANKEKHRLSPSLRDKENNLKTNKENK